MEPALAAAAAQTLQNLDLGSSRIHLEQRCLFLETYAQTNKQTILSNRAHNGTNNSTER